MTFDWSLLEGAVRGGDYLVVMAMLISIGLSAAYCFIIFKLLNLRAIAIPSRFTADFPETVFERAWMDFLKAVTILFRVVVLSIFLIVGLFGALVVSYVLVYLLASRENILQEGFSQEGIWIALFLFGVLPMTVVWLISLYIRDAGWGKWQFFSANPPMGSRPQAAPVMDISRVSPGQLSSLRVMIKLGFAGWILAGASDSASCRPGFHSGNGGSFHNGPDHTSGRIACHQLSDDVRIIACRFRWFSPSILSDVFGGDDSFD